MRVLDEIIVHCSATPPEWMKDVAVHGKVEEIRRWHTIERGWLDIGYHYVVDRDGAWLPAREVGIAGAHTHGHNDRSIGICLIGGQGAKATDQFADHFTPEQDKALRFLLKDLQKRFGKMKVTGHNRYSRKGCPGFSVPEWLGRDETVSGFMAFLEWLVGWLAGRGKQ